MYTIGKLAKLARVKTDSIRFYERQGLLSPAQKTGAGYRLYTDEGVRRIDFIKHAQRCGFSLTEIRELLQLRSSNGNTFGDVYRFVREKQADIDKTISALQCMSGFLSELLAARRQSGTPHESMFRNRETFEASPERYAAQA